MDSTPTILQHFESIGYTPPRGTFTVLAAFFFINELDNTLKIISMATGTKCLATKNYSKLGDVRGIAAKATINVNHNVRSFTIVTQRYSQDGVRSGGYSLRWPEIPASGYSTRAMNQATGLCTKELPLTCTYRSFHVSLASY